MRNSMRNVLWPRIYRKCVCGRGFAPDPTRGIHDALPNQLVGWERTPLPNPHPTKRDGIYRFCVTIWPRICIKCVCGRGFDPDPTGEAYVFTTLPQIHSRLGWDTPPHTPSHSAPSASRPSGSAPSTHNFWLRHWLVAIVDWLCASTVNRFHLRSMFEKCFLFLHAYTSECRSNW